MNFTILTSLAFALALALVTESTVIINAENETTPSFVVDYEHNQFLLDGEPFRYVSGSFHYFRAPRAYWTDRLRKIRAAGLNAVSTYVEWSLHQPKQSRWNWEDDADLEHFLTLAQEEDLFVLLRPGPYICAERDFGGLPVWLLGLVPDIRLRTSDTRYMAFVTTYLNEVMRRVQPFLRGNGGPVIMVQVENEYGSYNACDLSYMSQVRDLLSHHVGSKALLYTTDGASSQMLRCGMVPEVYTTVDFGVGSNVIQAFATMRLFQPKGPFVNSEFYPGWLTHWEESYQTVNSTAVARKLDEMLAMGASVNFYMFYGGTNFGITSGANTGPQYQPQLTSYDYDAPITEAGDLTPKYFDIQRVISKYLPIPNITLPPTSPKGDYGSVVLVPEMKLFDDVSRYLFGVGSPPLQDAPPTFESFGEQLPFVLYETDLPENRTDPSVLSVDFVHDRALVYEDDRFVGTLSRAHGIKTVSLPNPYGQRLSILVENQGHVNYGNKLHDFKGVGNVRLNGQTLSKWNSTGFKFGDPDPFNRTVTDTELVLDGSPVFLYGTFNVSGDPLDSYLDTTGWGKGIAIINGIVLGRYWPAVGPQMTLYVPASFLNSGENGLTLLELEYVPETRLMKFQTVPNMCTV